MLTCQGCIRHCLQTLIGESAPITNTTRTLVPTLSRHTRSYVGTSYERSQAGQIAAKLDGRKGTSPSEASMRTINRKKWLDSRGIRPESKKTGDKEHTDRDTRSGSKKVVHKERSDREIATHLTYLKDPLKLADFVRKKLRNDDFDFALEIVRAASKDVQCTVSWNHLVDWQLSRGKMNAAIQTYNEMKKRAQTPDAYTYTILFKGCSEHNEPEKALLNVLAIYNSMLIDKSPVKPNTIHMNAVLKMCSKAQNMDALFSIAAQFPPSGLRAPNNLTYTTILNALRMNAVTDGRSPLSPMEKRANCRKAIEDSRRVWADVIERWRKGDIWIDEELVASVGRLLLIGSERDWDDIFSLVEQTMNIPRQIPKLGSQDRRKVEPASQGQQQLAASTESSPVVQEGEGNPKDPEEPAPGNFIAIAAPVSKVDGISMYAKPTQNTLSLLLKASLELRLKATATSYWNILTKSLLIAPDSDNFHAYLRILRVARASTETVDILLQMPKSDLEIKTFRIAMAACARDKLNRNAFANAGKVLDLMQTNLPEPDMQVLEHYLDIATTSTVYSEARGGKREPSKLGQGKQILRALDRLNPSFINVKAAMQFGALTTSTSNPYSARNKPHEKEDTARNVINLTCRMVSALDLLMNKALVPRDMYGDLTKQRSKLAAFVTRYQGQRSERNPVFRKRELGEVTEEEISVEREEPRFQIQRV